MFWGGYSAHENEEFPRVFRRLFNPDGCHFIKWQVSPSCLQYGEDISPALGQDLLLQLWPWRPCGAAPLLSPASAPSAKALQSWGRWHSWRRWLSLFCRREQFDGIRLRSGKGKVRVRQTPGTQVFLLWKVLLRDLMTKKLNREYGSFCAHSAPQLCIEMEVQPKTTYSKLQSSPSGVCVAVAYLFLEKPHWMLFFRFISAKCFGFLP